ncbi:MAG: polymerase, sigma-24 subunit, subfamily [Microbacteriaceae bacterium]|jgi:RNA polymerase sigma factor (sigma-70 family)|nr:polymerase, sigma-24 subunit, subfamily [Microbacteriaceae bacterium]
MRRTQQTGLSGADRARLEAARRGDQAAFGTLYEAHVRDVYRYALRMLREASAAEDTTQDVFALAWVKRAEIAIVDVSLLPWLLVTTRNLCLNRLKQAGRTVELDAHAETVDTRASPEAALIDRQLAESIRTAVERLSPSDQELYRLCLVDEVPYGDAAAALGTTTGAVRNRLMRLRRTLRISLATHNEGLS